MNNANWTDPEFPDAGERVAYHILIGRGGRSVRQALFVGANPQGKDGKPNGKPVNARRVAVGDMTDASFDYFSLWYYQEIVHQNPDGPQIAEMTEMILQLQSRGFHAGQEPCSCPSCTSVKPRKMFRRTSTFQWKINKIAGEPRLVTNTACLDCLETRLNRLDNTFKRAKQIEESNDLAAMVVSDPPSHLSEETMIALAGADNFNRSIHPLRKLVSDMKKGIL